jgi:hypothetical protein
MPLSAGSFHSLIGLPNKALQLTTAGGRPSAFLWRSQLNAGTLAGELGDG